MKIVFRNRSFELRKGEILGFGGLPVQVEANLWKPYFNLEVKSGKVYMKGKERKNIKVKTERCL